MKVLGSQELEPLERDDVEDDQEDDDPLHDVLPRREVPVTEFSIDVSAFILVQNSNALA